MISCAFQRRRGRQRDVRLPNPGLVPLGFSVTVFCIEAMVAIITLMIRRNPAIGGELGGPKAAKTATSALFVFLWVFYVMIAALEAYGVIVPGF